MPHEVLQNSQQHVLPLPCNDCVNVSSILTLSANLCILVGQQTLSHVQRLNYSTKSGGSLRNSNMTGYMYMYTCVSFTGNFLRKHTHNTTFFKVPYHKSVKQKNDLVPWGACNG